MSPPIFVVTRAELEADRVLLTGSEGHHAATVRRLGVGERVDLTDGAGYLAECVVASAGRDVLGLDVLLRRAEPAPSPRLVVVQALAKGERAELAVEAMTEIGVDVVVPWEAARCIAQWKGERGAKALARWRSTAQEAGKQARRSRFPEVRELAGTPQVCDLLASAELAAVLHEEAALPLAGVEVPPTGDVVLVVGPEGGITPEELTAFAAAGAAPYRLGPSVFRTSTAGVAALAVVLSRTSRWGVSGR